jgi:hypothetical protein
MSKNRSPGVPFGQGNSRAGNFEAVRDGFDPRNNQKGPPDQVSPFIKVSKYVSLSNVPGAGAFANSFLGAMMHHAFMRQGPAAFDCPKSAACVHEAGHCVIYAIQGVVPEFVRIKRKWLHGREYWTGVIKGPTAWRVDRHSDVRQDYETASQKIAGVAAEMLFDRENFRHASSLDEALAVTLSAGYIAAKTGREAPAIVAEILARTGLRLKTYQTILLNIADGLDRRHSIRSQRLAAHLQPILDNEKASETPWGSPPGPEFDCLRS